MKKGCLALAVIVAIVCFMLASWGVSTYNSLVKQQEEVGTAWAQVENVYQRRADLIPNLNETVKGYAKHEQTTFENLARARAEATSIKIDPTNLDAEQLKKFQQAQGELSTALGRLIAISENYPELKANTNFLELQSQLEGTENRITVERNKFNTTAKEYNTSLRTFPTSVIASLFNFERKPYFEAEAGADKAPKVSFD